MRVESNARIQILSHARSTKRVIGTNERGQSVKDVNVTGCPGYSLKDLDTLQFQCFTALDYVRRSRCLQLRRKRSRAFTTPKQLTLPMTILRSSSPKIGFCGGLIMSALCSRMLLDHFIAFFRSLSGHCL